jgi:MFS family permease
MKPAAGVKPGFVILYALAYTALWLALLTPVIVTLALKIRQLDPAQAAQNISLVFSVGALFALVGNPVFGALSDRTTSRWGRRRPWLIGGSLVGLASLAVISFTENIATVLIGWCIAQLGFNAVLAAMVAVLPDRVPTAQRGTVAGVLGVCMPIGQVAGTFLVQALPGDPWMALLVPGTLGVAVILIFALALPDRPQQLPPRESASEILDTYLINPRRHPDFAWAWISRVFFVTGTVTLQTFQPLFLIEQLGLHPDAVPFAIFRSTLVQAGTIVLASVIAGRLSDRLGRRKLLVFAGSAIFGAGLWIVGACESYTQFLLAVAIAGIGHGTYVGVDLALFTDVLPDQQRDAAKDLGLVNVTNTLPQILSPGFAPLILAMSGGQYSLLFVLAGLIALLGSLSILPLKRVR